jgi:uncharacterized protein YbcV (DUF1398 family)
MLDTAPFLLVALFELRPMLPATVVFCSKIIEILMFTREDIQAIHDHLKGGLSEFAFQLEGIGVKKYITYITDGHSRYFGEKNYSVESTPVHEAYPVSTISDREACLRAIKDHEKKVTDYFEFSWALAGAGVETWVIDILAKTIAFCDRSGAVMVRESF